MNHRPSLSVLLPLLALLQGCAPAANSGFVSWLPDSPIVVAHRGGAALAPENTIRAVQRAQEPWIAAEVVEVDLHGSADGEIVVIHDAAVDRVTGAGRGCLTEQDDGDQTFGELAVSALTLEELSALDAGACFTDEAGATPFRGEGVAIPSLRELLTTFPGQRFMLEIKQTEPSIVPDLVDLVMELDAVARTCFLAFDESTTQSLAVLLPDEACLAMPSSGIRCLATDALFPFGGGGCPAYDVLWAPRTNSGLNLAIPRVIANARALGMPVFYWTIDDLPTMAEVASIGADGIVTDRPDLLRNLYEYQAATPPNQETE